MTGRRTTSKATNTNSSARPTPRTTPRIDNSDTENEEAVALGLTTMKESNKVKVHENDLGFDVLNTTGGREENDTSWLANFQRLEKEDSEYARGLPGSKKGKQNKNRQEKKGKKSSEKTSAPSQSVTAPSSFSNSSSSSSSSSRPVSDGMVKTGLLYSTAAQGSGVFTPVSGSSGSIQKSFSSSRILAMPERDEHLYREAYGLIKRATDGEEILDCLIEWFHWDGISDHNLPDPVEGVGHMGMAKSVTSFYVGSGSSAIPATAATHLVMKPDSSYNYLPCATILLNGNGFEVTHAMIEDSYPTIHDHYTSDWKWVGIYDQYVPEVVKISQNIFQPALGKHEIAIKFLDKDDKYKKKKLDIIGYSDLGSINFSFHLERRRVPGWDIDKWRFFPFQSFQKKSW